MLTTIITLIVAAVLFAVGKIRSDIVALCAVIVLLLAGILTPAEALSGFSSPVVIMMAGLFIVGGGILQTGLAKMVSGRLMRLAGNSEFRLFLLVMLITGGIGAFVSNTGTVALMLPIVVSMAASAKTDARRLLMPLAFASSMGGMLTLIGTPPNLVIDEVLMEAGHEGLSFFSFFPVGLVCMVTGIIVLLPLSKWLLSKHDTQGNGKRRRSKSLGQLVKEYRLTDNIFSVVISEESFLVGKSISEVGIHQNYGLTVLEVRHERPAQRLIRAVEQTVAMPDVLLSAGDILYVSGEKQAADDFVRDFGLQAPMPADALDFYHIGIAEILLLRQSKFIGRQLRDVGFRSKYSANVLGIRRNNDYLLDDLLALKLQAGDLLLVQGTWANIARLQEDEEHWVVLGQPLDEAARVTLDYKAPLAALIMLLMIGVMVVDFIPIAPVTAVLIASVLMILTGCFRSVEAAYKTINWESIVLIAAMMPMSVALEKTGVATLFSQMLATHLGGVSPLALLVGIYFATSLLTMFISNTATAVLMAPIAFSSATASEVNPMPMLFAVAVASSMCFASPFSTPPNALVMRAGRYTFLDYVRVGLPLQIIMGIVMIFVLPLLFPF